MTHNKNNSSVSGALLLVMVFVNAVILKVAFIYSENWYWALTVTLPLLVAAGLATRKKNPAPTAHHMEITRRNRFEEEVETPAEFLLPKIPVSLVLLIASGSFFL